jgi:hypothetical protein
MLSLADVIIKASAQNEKATVQQGHAWVQKALDIIVHTRAAASNEPPRDTPVANTDGTTHICEEALVATLFSLGSIAEVGRLSVISPAFMLTRIQMEDKLEDAKSFYTRSAVQATRIQLYENATEGKAAARRVERSQRLQNVASVTKSGTSSETP